MSDDQSNAHAQLDLFQHPEFEKFDRSLLKRFSEYHHNHQFVYYEFEKHALLLAKIGRRRYSAWAIINKIRWDWDLTVSTFSQDIFKINNDFIAIYVRIFNVRQPELRDFFETRETKRIDRKQSAEELRRLAENDQEGHV